jgi:hypothetical protein
MRTRYMTLKVISPMSHDSLVSLPVVIKSYSAHSAITDVLEATVDFEYVRAWLVEALHCGDGVGTVAFSINQNRQLIRMLG